MKNLFSLLLVCCLSITVAFACDGEGHKKAAVEQSGGEVVVAKFAALNLDIKGMTCGGCENKVKAALSGIDGVVETQKVCSQSDKASLTFDPAVTSSEAIIAALGEKTGYAVTVSKNAGIAEASTTEAAKAKSCTAAQKKACTKSAAKSCSKAKAVGTDKLEKE